MPAPARKDKITAHVLACGAMHCDLTWLLLQPGKAMASRADPAKPAVWTDCPTHAVLVDHPDGRILWDTSCPRDWESRWKPTGLNEFFPYDGVGEDEYLDSRLTQLGLGPQDIDMVVMSHLHFDHAGNLKTFAAGDTRLICHEKEYEHAHGFGGLFQGAHLKTDYTGVEFETVSGDTELFPGVTLLETPGHTPGTMSLQLELADTGTMIFTSDAVYMKASYGPPVTGAAIVWDNQAWLRSVEKIRNIAERTDATVVFGHDPDQIHELRTAPAGAYT
jgi:glyoxylase-like metal-dependent hydrolase (beta-lactamase superfamily II)